MRGLILIIFMISGLVAETINISGQYRDLLNNPIESARVTYHQDLTVVDSTLTNSSGYFNLSIEVVSVDPVLPAGFQLGQNYPNPFNPSTRIDVSIQKPGSFSIYDIRGALVETLDLPSAGSYELIWGGRNLGAGLYIYVLRSGSQSTSRKMILLDGGDGSGLTVNQTAYVYSRQLLKPASNDRIKFAKQNTSGYELSFTTPLADTSLGAVQGNIGPVLIQAIPDTSVLEGDTLILDWSEYFYNDSDTRYESFIYPPPIAGFYNMQIIATDVMDSTLIAESNVFIVTEIVPNTAPTINLPDTISILEDQPPGLILTLLDYSNDPEGDSLSFAVVYQQHPELVNVTLIGDSLAVDTLMLNGYGNSTINISASDGVHSMVDSTVIVVTPVNDAPVFSGYIEGITFPPDEFDATYVVTINEHFSDPDGDDLTIGVNLDPDYWTYEAGDFYIFPLEGDTLDVVITASDGELTSSSNNFPVIWPNEVIIPPDTVDVYFEIRDFKTDSLITDDTTTWTVDGVEYTSIGGTLQLELAEEAHTFDATNPNTIDGMLIYPPIPSTGNWGNFTFFRRPGQTENIEQIAGPDTIAEIEIIAQDTIIAYKIMNDFNLLQVARYLNDNGNGSVRFGPDDLNAYAWMDTSGTHVVPWQYVRNSIDRLLTEELPRVTNGKLQLQYIESETNPNPGESTLYMFIDSSVPGSGNNITFFDENYMITSANASWPSSPGPGEGDLYIEILQAVGDLPDIGGSNPQVISYVTGTGFIINELGESTFSLLYFVNPGTYFRN